MTGYVVDASVAVKWLVAEPYSEQAARLLDGETMLAAPELLFAEVTNALWAMRRRGDVELADFVDAASLLKAMPVTVPVSMRALAPSAGRLAADLDHPAYDCFYLALSMQEQYPVVTADRRFFEKVRGHPYLSGLIVHIESVGPE